MAQLTITQYQAKLHLAILGKRDLYHAVAKNYENGKVVNAWLRESEITDWALEKNGEGYTCWVSLNDKEEGEDSIEGVKALNVFWLDIDSKRNSKTIPATKEQLKETLQRAQNLKEQIENEYAAKGFLACSGNGYHIFFPLPRFELVGAGFRREINQKVKQFAKQASEKVNAEIDSTYDIRRVTTLIGSPNLKIPTSPLETQWITNSEQERPTSVTEVDQARIANRVLLEAILNTETRSQTSIYAKPRPETPFTREAAFGRRQALLTSLGATGKSMVTRAEAKPNKPSSQSLS